MSLDEDMNILIEQLAELEHLQWMEWSKQISDTEKISPMRIARWQKLWIPYSELPEEMKEQGRKWARRSFDISRDFVEYL